MTNWHEIIKQTFPNSDLRFGEPMKNHITFRLGGNAECFVTPKTGEELGKFLQFAEQYQIRTTILGAGSNVLVADAGVSGLVISTHRGLIEIAQTGELEITAQSGVTMAKLSTFARDLGLSGLEFAHGIPGTVGGGIFMNAGAYGGEMSQVAVESTILLEDGTMATIDRENHGFAYRHSNFQEHNWIALETKFRLNPGKIEEISEKMEEYSQRRRNSQPLEFPSGGSTFKRPATGYAAALIEQAGLKGFSVGGAQVSEKHSGFVINKNAATCQDVLDLMVAVQKKVESEFGIQLEPELRVI